MKATVFAPGSVGNVGPGFDILGLAIDGIGDRVTVETGRSGPVIVRGRDAELVPTDPAKNAAAIAARAMTRGAQRPSAASGAPRPFAASGAPRPSAAAAEGGGPPLAEPGGPPLAEGGPPLHITIDKGLPVAAGLGGSASSSVAGALAAAIACEMTVTPSSVMLAALEGEMAVSGRHLDNIAPITLGGLALSRSMDPIDVIALRAPENWSLALITPNVRIETKKARAILPERWERESWVQQMANATALAIAFMTADGGLARRALDDLYAEPRRAPMIPHFFDVKRAALDAGAFGCSISGSGPTIFALAESSNVERCAQAMRRAMAEVPCEVRVAGIARQGAHPV